MFMPTGYLYVVKSNGEKENIMIADFSTKKEIRENIRDYIQDMIKRKNTRYEEWVSISYERKGKVLYEDTIENCMNEKAL